MNKIDWSKAPKGATHFTPNRGIDDHATRPVFWRVIDGAARECWAMSNDLSSVKDHFKYGPEGCPAYRAFMSFPRPAAWTGTGLPPVGTVCEAWHNGCAQGVVEVRYSGGCIVLWNVKLNQEQCSASENYTFKPIRTPEQIAAEEREKAIEQMMEDYKYKEGPCTHHLLRSQAERIYDAGYRKVEGGDA